MHTPITNYAQAQAFFAKRRKKTEPQRKLPSAGWVLEHRENVFVISKINVQFIAFYPNKTVVFFNKNNHSLRHTLNSFLPYPIQIVTQKGTTSLRAKQHNELRFYQFQQSIEFDENQCILSVDNQPVRKEKIVAKPVLLTENTLHFFQCGICNFYHPVDFKGNCKESPNTFAELCQKYGDNWIEDQIEDEGYGS